MRYALILALLITSFTAAAALGDGVVSTLTIIPDTTLPGVPVSIAVHLTNNGNTPATLANYVRVQGTDQHGASFFAKLHKLDDPDKIFFSPSGDPSLVLAPGASTDVFLPISHALDGPPLFDNPKAVTPGRLLVQVYYTIDGSEASTAPAVLTIRQPSGVDSAVWNLMTATVNGPWTTDAWESRAGQIALKVLSAYPSSGYAPYFALFAPGKTGIERLPFLAQGLSAANGPIADELRMCIASAHLGAMSDALFAERNLEKALAEANAARLMIDQVRKSPYPFFGVSAAEAAKDLFTSNQIREIFTRRIASAPAAPLPLQPTVDCVEASVTDNTYIVRFGFSNPNYAGKFVDIGQGNHVVPGPPDRNQPRYFRPGEYHDVFGAVVTDGTPARWDLDGKSAEASASFPTHCSPPASSQALVPIVDCVRTDADQKVSVTFGYINPNSIPLRIAIGAANQVTGVTAGKDQPTIFVPGVQHDVWTVKAAAGDSIVWTLDGSSVTASALTARCYNPGTDY